MPSPSKRSCRRPVIKAATALTYINRAAIWSQGYTETVYDATGRPARSFAPNDEQTDYGYAGRSTAVFAMGRSGDPNKVVKWQEVDGLGYLKRLRTYTKPYSEGGSVQATIDLSHDVLGNLRTVTHPNSIGTTTIDYDLASRKISLIDPDLGSWSYTYNRQNQLISQTDGRDKTICLYYDGFERLFGKRFPSNSTCPTSGSYQVLYNYDQNHSTSNRSRGQVTYVSNGNFTKWLSYNNKGLLDYETVRILGASEDYTTTYGYDSYLRLNTLKYPDDEIVTTTYNSMGLPRTLTSGGVTLVDGDTNNDDDTTDTYDGANYDAAGRLVQMNFTAGGNLWQTRGYHGWTTTSTSYAGDGNGRLYYIHTGTTKGGQDRLNLAYHYDSFGNLVYFHDNTAYHTLTYDEQNRITAAYSTSYGYDHSRRLTSYEGSSQPVNTTFPAHAIKKSGYSYDANGNLVARAGRTLNWDHENRAQRAPVSVTGGGLPNESYIYDDDGIRVKKYTNGTGTYYPFPHYEVTGSTITKYYFFGGQRIAMRKGGTLTYLHADHLGSTVLETNTSGNPTANQQYCAYGRKRTLSNGTTVCGSGNSLATDHTFTGQQLDATGLQYFNARYYDPVIGTFIAPDTIVPDATSAFDYNRYMYASGNPLKFSDPTGHCNAAGGLSGRVLSADSCGGWGAGVAARAAIQLAVDTASAVILANSAVQAVQPHQESVPLPQPTVEVSGVPLQDQTPHSGWLTSFDAPPQQQVLADPLPTAEKGSNIVYSRDTLRSNMGITDPNLQAHHIIPHSLSTHDLVKLATQAGWDINAAYNGIGLPNNDIDGAEVGVIYHSGNHQN